MIYWSTLRAHLPPMPAVPALLVLLATLCLGLAGCSGLDTSPFQAAVPIGNPTIVASADKDLLWDTIVDIVDDDFEIQREERPRQVGDVLTEGRLETRPLIGATVLEPWRSDSVTSYDRWESTLQTIRRRAIVHMAPAAGGYQVQVTVLKELENLGRPEFATTSAATFRHDSSILRFSDPVDAMPVQRGWIPLGSDPALEQRILSKLHGRLGM
jgi:hypothetical protein